ncbi:hypothetical protein PspLS_06298 [Pyricularia sp. CBS 133598]|nr:hypothetical protein PspLS_06298 [Pyricularia sp. CBS 133598]
MASCRKHHTESRRSHANWSMQYPGPWVRYGPSRLVINTETAVRAIYGPQANCIKSKAYGALVHGAPNILTLSEKEEHAWRRRVMSLAFSDAKVKSYEGVIRKNIKTLCDILQGSIDGPAVDFGKLSNMFTFDITSEVVFGTKTDAMKGGEWSHIPDAIEESNVRVGTLLQSPLLSSFRLDRKLFPASIRARNEFLAYVTALLGKREEATSADNGNVFSLLEQAKDPAGSLRSLSRSQVRGECATLIVAGSDTSSTTLSATLFYLAGDRDAQRRAREEVLHAMPGPDDVALGPALNSCAYLRSSVDEALRLSPPVGGPPWREVCAGGMTIDGEQVPAGVDVGVGIYSLHHGANHRDPFKFRPERWLMEGSGSARSAFMPFSTGSRSCVGKGFAYHEILLTLATLLQRFEFSREADGVDGEFLLKDHITGAKTGPFLKFTRVK